MRLSLLATAAACALLLAPASPVAAQDQQQSRAPDQAALHKQPMLDGVAMSFAYDRMNGGTPDFRRYAERSTAYTAATVFDRDAVRAREIERYQALFQNFDLGKVYNVRLRTELRQYSSDRGGYAVGLSEDAFIPIRDSVTGKEYGLQIRNTDDVNFVPVGDAAKARAFAQRTELNTQSAIAGSVTLEMAFRLMDAPPALDNGGRVMVRADVLAARVLSSAGAVIHDFGLTPAASQVPQRPGEDGAERTVLKATDVQGLRVGMTLAEADGVVSRGWTTRKGSQETGEVLWFNGLEARQGDWFVCGALTNGVPSLIESNAGVQPPAYKDCIGYGLAREGASNGPYSNRVHQVVAQQFLIGIDPATLRRTLEEKYGKPTYVRNGGANLVWIGRNAAQPNADLVKIEARMGSEGGPAAQAPLIFQISMLPYVDPQRPIPVAAPPAVPSGPKL